MSRSSTYREALREALQEGMRRDPSILLVGEDIAEYGGVFKVTEGLLAEFGLQRVVDTPIAEAGFLGAAIGAAMSGKRPVVELMFMDFALVAADQLFNQAAKMRLMSGDQWRVPLVVRTQQGVGSGTGAQHSQSFEALFMHLPGFAVAVPSTPADAKGLLATALRLDDPSIVIEHKKLYGVKGDLPDGEHLVPFGKAAVRRPGRDLTIVSWSAMAGSCEAAATELAASGIEAEVIDPRTLVPFDYETVCDSVARTGRLLVVHEAHRSTGPGAEIAATVTEQLFDRLNAPVARLGGLDMPVPYAESLEQTWLPQVPDIVEAATKLVRA